MISRHAPIQRKLMSMLLITSGLVLVITCAAFLGYEFATYRETSVRQMSTLGAIVAAQSTGATAFDNARDATEILSTLQAEPNVVAAALYNAQGRLFSRYPAEAPDALFPARPPPDGLRFRGDFLESVTPVVQAKGSDRFGTLYLRTDLQGMYDRVRLYGGIALLVILVAGLMAFGLSRLLARRIADPVHALARTARAVSERRDYSVRAEKQGNDEIGLLTDAFNQMLAQIERQNAELEQRVLARTAELKAANDELEAFGSTAAHDLRTPLRAIMGFTDVLLDDRTGPLSPLAARYVRNIRAGASQMGQLIDDLLSFSRLGRQELTRRQVDMEALCRSVLRQLESDLGGRRVSLKIGALPTVRGDPALIRVVLMNLLSNALKYSRPRNPARVEVGARDQPGENGPVFFVKDNGVGFDMTHAGRLFGVFQRLHLAHEFEGTGVGLATVRRIVERHGGRIWAEAKTDEGSTFYFVLPRG